MVSLNCVKYTRIRVLSGPHIPVFRLNTGISARISPYKQENGFYLVRIFPYLDEYRNMRAGPAYLLIQSKIREHGDQIKPLLILVYFTQCYQQLP